MNSFILFSFFYYWKHILERCLSCIHETFSNDVYTYTHIFNTCALRPAMLCIAPNMQYLTHYRGHFRDDLPCQSLDWCKKLKTKYNYNQNNTKNLINHAEQLLIYEQTKPDKTKAWIIICSLFGPSGPGWMMPML